VLRLRYKCDSGSEYDVVHEVHSIDNFASPVKKFD